MEKIFPLRHQQFFGSSEPFFRFSNLVNSAESLLDVNRDHMLAEARSELVKQESKVDFLNTSAANSCSAVGIRWCTLRI